MPVPEPAALPERTRLLLDRTRGGLWVILACVGLFMVGDVNVSRTVLPRLYILKLSLVAAVVTMLLALRRTTTWRGAITAALLTVNLSYAAIAASDVLAGHLDTTPLLAAVCSMSAAALLPWGVRAQAATAAFMGLGNLVTLALTGRSIADLADPATAVIATLGVSVYVAWQFERYRCARKRAEDALAERARVEALRAEVHLRACEKGGLRPKLQACAEAMVRHLDAAFARIWTLGPGGTVLELEASAGLYTHLDGGHARVPVGRYKIGRIAEECRPHLTNAVLDDPRISDPEWARREGMVAFAGHPLLVDDRLLGVVAMFARHPLGEATLGALGSVAHAIASMVARARAEEALAASRVQLEEEAAIARALAHVGQEMISSLDTPVVYERLCQVTTEVLGASSSATLLWQPDEDVYVPVAEYGVTREQWAAGARVRATREAVSLLFSGEDGDVAEVAAWQGAPPAAGGPRLCIALRRGKDLVGAQVTHWCGRTAPFAAREHRIALGIARIASMALANARLLEELARASRLKSEFVSTMSHELRTPLHVILGYAEIARDRAPGVAPEDCLERIEAAGRDLLELIESTLEIGRIEAGRAEVRLEPLLLPAFWEELGRRCARLPRRQEVRLEWGAAPAGISVVTDPHKLTIIMRNLVGNALKFTEQGRVRVEAEVDGDDVVVRVSDTGLGIRPEDREAIFEMFRQADGSDSRRHGGAGLGLYIVRRFAQQLGGSVRLESSPGRGSVFTVRVPRCAASPLHDAA